MAENKRKNALLAGATGLVGQQLLPLLAENYAQVHVLTRRPLPTSTASLAGVVPHVIDFAALVKQPSLPELPKLDAVYIALGTTIKVAGSEAAFYAVDFAAVLAVATAARRAGASRCAVVSAMGASPQSRVFYNRTKGEMEAALASLGFEQLCIVRPSLLAGDRASLGQATRPGEKIGLVLSNALSPLIPRKYRSISARAVAKGMLHFMTTQQSTSGVHVIESDVLQGFSLV
jgi:uncharacterized protein YbjT (DUF2867 family)